MGLGLLQILGALAQGTNTGMQQSEQRQMRLMQIMQSRRAAGFKEPLTPKQRVALGKLTGMSEEELDAFGSLGDALKVVREKRAGESAKQAEEHRVATRTHQSTMEGFAGNRDRRSETKLPGELEYTKSGAARNWSQAGKTNQAIEKTDEASLTKELNSLNTRISSNLGRQVSGASIDKEALGSDRYPGLMQQVQDELDRDKARRVAVMEQLDSLRSGNATPKAAAGPPAPASAAEDVSAQAHSLLHALGNSSALSRQRVGYYLGRLRVAKKPADFAKAIEEMNAEATGQ